MLLDLFPSFIKITLYFFLSRAKCFLIERYFIWNLITYNGLSLGSIAGLVDCLFSITNLIHVKWKWTIAMRETYRSVRPFLPSMLPSPSVHLHVHIIYDVEEIFHYRDSLESLVSTNAVSLKYVKHIKIIKMSRNSTCVNLDCLGPH